MSLSPSASRWLRAALIALAVAFVYGPSIRGGWLWDDNQEVTENAVLPDPGGLAKIWSGAAGADYFPLKTTLQWLEWRLWGADPAGYHATSVLLHLASALLFWRLLSRLGLRWGWVGGLLFAVHPLAVESVAWAAELKNTLSQALILGASLAWVEWDEEGRGKAWAYGLSLALFAAAMLAKSSVVMFPFGLLLYGWWRRRRMRPVALAPFFALSLALGLITVWFQHHRAMQPELIVAGALPSRVACAGLALLFYLAKAILPLGLAPIYPRWDVDPPQAWQFLVWAVPAGLFIGLAARRTAGSRATIFGLGWFFLNLLPVIGFITITYMRITWVADHFAYLSLLGVVALAVAGAERAGRRLGNGVLAGVLGVAVLLAGESRAYAGHFRDEIALWTYAEARNPQAWPAHYNLGTYLGHRGQLDRAVAELEATVRLKPEFAEGHFNLGNALLLERRLPEALAQYETAVRLKPGEADFRVGLGTALYFSGRAAEAVEQYQTALRLRPGDSRIEYNLNVARRAIEP